MIKSEPYAVLDGQTFATQAEWELYLYRTAVRDLLKERGWTQEPGNRWYHESLPGLMCGDRAALRHTPTKEEK